MVVEQPRHAAEVLVGQPLLRAELPCLPLQLAQLVPAAPRPTGRRGGDRADQRNEPGEDRCDSFGTHPPCLPPGPRSTMRARTTNAALPTAAAKIAPLVVVMQGHSPGAGAGVGAGGVGAGDCAASSAAAFSAAA